MRLSSVTSASVAASVLSACMLRDLISVRNAWNSLSSNLVLMNRNSVVVTWNGVIHVIDKVMVPAGFTLVETAEETVIPKTDDETVLFSGMLILAGLAGMTATVVYGRRRKAVRVSSDK